MVRKLVIAALPAALAVGQAGTALAEMTTNGVQVNGTHINGINVNGQGTQGISANGAGGAVVISIELPAPAAH